MSAVKADSLCSIRTCSLIEISSWVGGGKMAFRTRVETEAPTTIKDIDLAPRGRVFPSPMLWKEHVFYQVLPDRFSDGREAERPLFDRHQPGQHQCQDKRRWMEAGLRFNGGTLQ